MGLSLIAKQILGEIDNAAEALESKLNSDLLPALKGGGSPWAGVMGAARVSTAGHPPPAGGLTVGTPIFKNFPPSPP
jgi:hypothetical protein